MPLLSLTDFVDVVCKSGRPKATKVAQVKARPDYEPCFDFYKPLRDAIVDSHRRSLGKGALLALMTELTDPKKLSKYPRLVEGYRRWWGRKDLVWFDPPRADFTDGDFHININPELGLEYKGERLVIKLYFKDEKLSKLKVGVITYLMNSRLQPMGDERHSFGVLDVGNAKLLGGQGDPSFEPILAAEIAYIAALWEKV